MSPALTLAHTFDADAQHGLVRTGTRAIFRWNPSELAIVKHAGEQPVALAGQKVSRVVARPRDKIYIVAETSVPDADGYTPKESVHLVDENGSLLESWPVPEGVLDIAAPTRRAYVLTFDGLMRLDPNHGRVVLEPRQPRETQLLLGLQGDLILCRANDERESAHLKPDEARARCRSRSGWVFEGSWSSVKPVVCGEWIIEPVQGVRASETSSIRVRSLVDGRVAAEAPVRMKELACVSGGAVLDRASGRALSLPDLDKQMSVTCGGQRVVAVTQHGSPAMCISARGKVEEALLEPSSASRRGHTN
jgi:hypothetical protein